MHSGSMGAAGNGGLLLSGKTAATRKLLPKESRSQTKLLAGDSFWRANAGGRKRFQTGTLSDQSCFQERTVFRASSPSGETTLARTISRAPALSRNCSAREKRASEASLLEMTPTPC